jgi:hypothetical protein
MTNAPLTFGSSRNRRKGGRYQRLRTHDGPFSIAIALKDWRRCSAHRMLFRAHCGIALRSLARPMLAAVEIFEAHRFVTTVILWRARNAIERAAVGDCGRGVKVN